MAEVTYNIGDDLINREALFKKVFLNAPYPLARGKVSRERTLSAGQFVTVSDEEVAGFYPVRFRYRGTSFVNGKPVALNINLSPRLEPLWELTLQKNIVQTPVAGRDFSVKEIISAEDWQIRIRGFFVYDEALDGEDIPTWRNNTINALNHLARANASIEVECDLLAYLGFDRIVIKQLRLPALEGYAKLIPYEIEAISDEIVELRIEN